MDTEENQKQVFHAAHKPLEITSRFPHSRNPDRYPHGKVEIQRQDCHFPTLVVPHQTKNKRKEINPRPDRFASGSSVD